MLLRQYMVRLVKHPVIRKVLTNNAMNIVDLYIFYGDRDLDNIIRFLCRLQMVLILMIDPSRVTGTYVALRIAAHLRIKALTELVFPYNI